MPESDSPGWAPDARTVRWVAGILHEDRIAPSLRAEFEERRGELTPADDEYWRLLGSIAVEHVTADLWDQATTWPGWSDLPEG